jgi:biopolymer transport protein ExbD
MAGSVDEENPVGINVTAMVDVIFCLCIFFMCSLKFKQLEGKFDSWLPKGKGVGGVGDTNILQEIRVAMYWDADLKKTIRQFTSRKVQTDEELQDLIRGAYEDYVRIGKPEAPVIIDAEAQVPWDDVINVLNLCKRNKIENIEFALGKPPAK